MTDAMAAASRFIADDIDDTTKLELTALLARAQNGDVAAIADLGERFAGTLQFGTAGLRGRVEAGTNRMNRAVVVQATWGLGSFILKGDHDQQHAASRGVVIAFDGRLSSRQFAEDAAGVLTAMGIVVHMFFDPQPTPVCAFTVAHLNATAGIMVTASHNPPADNGYKVYWANAAQIVPPVDTGVTAHIAMAPAANQIPRLAPADAVEQGLRRNVSDDVIDAYLKGVQAGGWHRDDNRTKLRITYTAMHGVGHRLTMRSLLQAGFDGVSCVADQVDPDGTFRTVAFPNPEEKGALDRATATAREHGSELILANDPDADRLAVAVHVGDGQYRALSGNEIGALLCHDALVNMPSHGKRKLAITTIVSSTLLSRIARDLGAAYEEVLTGFKWIANKAMEREREGLVFVGGYEEAIGFSLGNLVRDKDGVGSAVRLAELARHLKANGKTLLDQLDDIAVRHGLSVGTQWSSTLPGTEGLARIRTLMSTMRTTPPTALAGDAVVRVDDLQKTMAADVIVVRTSTARLTIRPSGTEPKIKFYLELEQAVAQAGDLPAARLSLEARARQVQAEVRSSLSL